MKRSASFSVFFLVLILCVSVFPQPAHADDMWVKLGRGVCDIGLSPGEIPYQMYVMEKTQRAPIAFFGGLAKGLATGIRRFGVGIYEVFTFPFPGKNHYQPILTPEFIVPEFLA